MKEKIILVATVLFFFLSTSCNNTTTDSTNSDTQDTMVTMPAGSPTDMDTVTHHNPPAVTDTTINNRPADSMPLK
jgi:hypothetical protein